METKTFDDLAETDDPLDALAPPRSRAIDQTISRSTSRSSSRPVPIPPPPPIVSPRTAAVGIASIKAARRRGDHRPTFVLRNTGGVAIVKRPSMLALANSQALPSHLRPLLEAVAVRAVRAPGDAIEEELNRFDLDKMIELVDATCIEGFINPMLVITDHVKDLQDQVHVWPGADQFAKLEDEGWLRCSQDGQDYDEDVMYVDEIDVDDRAEFFGWCNERQVQEAQAVAPFPANGPEPVPPAPRRQGVSPVQSRGLSAQRRS